MPTVLITGCSSGFGLETARLFLERGWKVIATMRQPKADVLPASDHLTILPLDVTDPDSIAKALVKAGEVDVLVNNAGFGAAVPIELIEPETARLLFETNTLGTLSMVQSILPSFRARRSGAIINVTSTVTLKPLPLVSVYRASKAAVNALTESLAVEMAPFGVRVHIVLPGRSPETSFGNNAMPHLRGLDNPDYTPMIENMIAGFRDENGPVTHAIDVAEAVWRAATDPTAPLEIAAGDDAVQWLAEAS
ncbi:MULTISPECIES: SDR family oxidoreductase [unclassified Novosphingobium]|uniref:SDR family oxidoreductase n=1 Tax=unclassified Novosphingobium TaxID=2644732 RepID=UPI00146D3EBA|nr:MULTISPECIES: SDR family oxidoreductase [unclassified Novosphingobium]NMN04865.1 NAD(P)-dependent dehydrogenase (short-subunit alcohol dehydrogenase family) [Novosphingobium sp. SG919]NMN85141.1 NAD(P)-dependent dehydrogenase (short-subunit alcohol dehydrogenase family) [Novosphingobium sp. SG916]